MTTFVAPGTGARVLQACNACRRRKTKCNGVRPACGGCTSRRLPCSWPMIQPHSPLLYGVHEPVHGSSPDGSDHIDPSRKRPRLPGNIKSSQSELWTQRLTHRALEIFYERHHATDFCSFLHIPSLDIARLREQSPFFTHAIISLAALYLSKEEAAKESNLEPAALSEWHAVMAREYARRTADLPSIRSVQANLILSQRELLSYAPHKAWIFIGIAIRQAQALRLGRGFHSRVPNRQREVQGRTYWACFVMDRLISYACWRPQGIDADCISINLPCPERIFAFDEQYEAPKLETLPFPCEVSKLGLTPYYIAALDLWGEATYAHIKGGRRYISRTASSFNQLKTRLVEFNSFIPDSMQWSTANRNVFRHMSQEALFINFHLLMLTTSCIISQEYLPYPQEAWSVSTQDTAAETSADAASPATESAVVACTSSSERIVGIVSELWHDKDTGRHYLQSVPAAFAIMSATNIQLWLQHVGSKDESTVQLAKERLETMRTVCQSWKAQWPVSDAWSNTLVMLNRLYEATYSQNVADDSVRQGNDQTSAPPNIAEDAQDRPVGRLTEGNGLPDFKERMVDKIRFTLLSPLEDNEARERVLRAAMTPARDSIATSDDYSGGFEYWAPQEYEFGLPELFLDDSWPGLGDADTFLRNAA